MKTKKMFLGFAALIGFGLLITLNAFKPTAKENFTYWQYEAASADNIRNGASYTPIAAPTTAPCETGSDLPCVLQVDQSIDTQAKLDAYLHNTSMFPAQSDITNAAVYKKDAE